MSTKPQGPSVTNWQVVTTPILVPVTELRVLAEGKVFERDPYDFSCNLHHLDSGLVYVSMAQTGPLAGMRSAIREHCASIGIERMRWVHKGKPIDIPTR